MTRGRRREKTYTGHNGAATDRLRALDLLARQAGGVSDPASPPSQDALRRMVEAQMCPWCPRGPFKVIALHAHRAHGIGKDELREMIGVIKGAVICDPDLSRQRSERLRGTPFPRAEEGSRPISKRNYSTAGRAVQRAKLRDAVEAGARRYGGEAEFRAAAAAAAGQRALTANAERHLEAHRLWVESELTLQQIAAAVGLHPRTVGISLRRVGLLAGDARTLRQARAGRVGAQQIRAMQSGWRAATNSARLAFIAEFEELGCTFAATEEMASRHGVSAGAVRERLRSYGVEVPDGRRHTPRRFGRVRPPKEP